MDSLEGLVASVGCEKELVAPVDDQKKGLRLRSIPEFMMGYL
jgi:hypothetical protein